uniref:Serine-rich adhesin for platelets-like n=2 Tax=Salarias fasciatus TaxID=181472 RepID=A0A672IFF8_SALFA
MKRESDRALQLSVCTWMIEIPAGKTVLLKPEWSGSGSSVWVRCILKEKNQALESGRTAVLFGCHRNQAALTWTGEGHSSNVVQLAYSVQEDERNSSDGRLTHQPDQDLTGWAQTGTSFTSPAPIGQETVKSTEGGRGHLCEGLESSSDPRCPSNGSTQDPVTVLPTSAQQGLSVAGRTDRETLPLPEEKPNNEADTSGAAHLTDAPVTARERTHPYFDPELNTNSTYPINETPPAQTETTLSFHTMFHTDMQRHTSSQTPKHTYKHMTTETDQSVSGSVPLITSSGRELPSQTVVESDTTVISQDVAVVGTHRDKPAHPWRSLRNTDRVSSDLSSSTTSSPLKSSLKPLQDDSHSSHAYTDPTSASESASASQSPSRTCSSTPQASEIDTAVNTTEAASVHPNTSQRDSFVSATSDVTVQTPGIELSEKFENTEVLDALISFPESQTNAEPSTESVSDFPYLSSSFITPAGNKDAESTQRNLTNADTAINTISTSPVVSTDSGQTSFITRASLTTNDDAQNTETTKGTYMVHQTHTNIDDDLPTNSPTPVPLLVSSLSTSPHTLRTHTQLSDSSHTTLTSSVNDSTKQLAFVDLKSTATPFEISQVPQPDGHPSLSPPTERSRSDEHHRDVETTTRASLVSITTQSDHGKREKNSNQGDERWQWMVSSTTSHTPTAGPAEPRVLQTTPPPRRESHPGLASSTVTSTLIWSSAGTPKFYVVPDQPVVIKAEYIELLLQIVVEDSKSSFTAGLEEETAAWVEPYLQKAPGFSRLLGVWSSGHAVQSLVNFRTSEALQWLGVSEPTSLLEQTGLAQALREGRTFRSSRITNITVGGLQGEVCGWLLQCPAGYKCRSKLGSANYSCSSVCHFDHCHHHGICTHHPGQLPVCRCLAGDDFWYMGRRCDVRMTRARLVGACLAVVVIIVAVIGVLAFVAVRRYRAILIQAKVDQTRSSYRRFNHFDELSGRFWLRSWAGSADSLDNPAFARSNDLLHLRALDRPCCYHDDTLSLASTCPSHGTHINTIYPHSSQYGWRGSEMSVGDGVLDSGKASDLSVCSWPVEPIHWTPFPLLQQLASHRTPTVRVSRPRSYCEGMELVDLGRSWTA